MQNETAHKCIRCGKNHNGLYGQRCEDCWSLAQADVGEPVGIPYLPGLGERRPLRQPVSNNPDFGAMLRGGFVAVM